MANFNFGCACENIEEDEEENISIIEVLSIKKKALPTPCAPRTPSPRK
jgi:hypothetical protein